jgi:hypothetical protein
VVLSYILLSRIDLCIITKYGHVDILLQIDLWIMKADPPIIALYGHEDNSTLFLSVVSGHCRGDVASGIDKFEG